jgi:DNA adenine methylase
MAEGASLLKHGEAGRGLNSRWYPQTLKERIEKISEHRDRITFLHGDGIRFIEANLRDKQVAVFIDPPYTVAGRRLYTHSDMDHRKLFELASRVCGPLLMTYDNAAEIRSLAREFGFGMRRVGMRTAHHSQKTELLICRDLGWFNARTLYKYRG